MTGSIVERSALALLGIGASRIETTNSTGRGSRPSTSWSGSFPPLPQRQVEGGALEGPAAVVGETSRSGGGEEVEPHRAASENESIVCSPASWVGPRVLQGDVVERVVDDVLADALLALAPQVDHGAEPREAGSLVLAGLELVGLDLQGQVRDLLVAVHEQRNLAGRVWLPESWSPPPRSMLTAISGKASPRQAGRDQAALSAASIRPRSTPIAVAATMKEATSPAAARRWAPAPWQVAPVQHRRKPAHRQ